MGGHEVFVPEQFLHAAEVGAGVEQVGGITVAKLVRGEGGIEPSRLEVVLEVELHEAWVNGAEVVRVGEENGHLAGGRMLQRVPITFDGRHSGRADGDLAFFFAFAVHTQQALGAIEIEHAQPACFTDA